MHHLVAYDMADPGRLQRVARRLEKAAVRCQKSVFVFRGDAAAVAALLDSLLPLIRPDEDVIQAWKLAAGQSPVGSLRGTPLPALPGGVVLAPRQTFFVDDVSD